MDRNQVAENMRTACIAVVKKYHGEAKDGYWLARLMRELRITKHGQVEAGEELE